MAASSKPLVCLFFGANKNNSLSGFWQDATALKIFVICIHFLFTPPSPPPVCQHDTTLLFSKGAEMEADRERKWPLSAVL